MKTPCRIALCASALLASPLRAEDHPLTVTACTPSALEARIVTTSDFANGAIRLSLLDLGQPQMAPFALMLTGSGLGATADTQCRYLSWAGDAGFAMLDSDRLESSYDPAHGLVLSMDGRLYDLATDFSNTLRLTLVVNQAAQSVTASYAITGDH